MGDTEEVRMWTSFTVSMKKKKKIKGMVESVHNTFTEVKFSVHTFNFKIVSSFSTL